MDDLAICRRIAEIEDIILYEDNLVIDYALSEETGYDEYKDYNPLTDDALGLRLLAKYKPHVTYNSLYKVWDYGRGRQDERLSETSLKKAICLGIIKADKK